jgi:hypothetical protein
MYRMKIFIEVTLYAGSFVLQYELIYDRRDRTDSMLGLGEIVVHVFDYSNAVSVFFK